MYQDNSRGISGTVNSRSLNVSNFFPFDLYNSSLRFTTTHKCTIVCFSPFMIWFGFTSKLNNVAPRVFCNWYNCWKFKEFKSWTHIILSIKRYNKLHILLLILKIN